MKLSFLYQHVTDLASAVDFHRDVLGLDEAWREADDTVAFRLPDSEVQVMVSTTGKHSGPMYLVDDADAWAAAHPDLTLVLPREEIPGGVVLGFAAPGDNVFYVFDQREDDA